MSSTTRRTHEWRGRRSVVRWCDVRLFRTAVLACSRSGRAKTRLGCFFPRDFDFSIGDGLLHRRRQLRPFAVIEDRWCAPSVTCSDYVDGLGFRVTFEAPQDGRTGLLGLEPGNNRTDPRQPNGRPWSERVRVVHVEEVDAYHHE